jgi:hypothetical protein
MKRSSTPFLVTSVSESSYYSWFHASSRLVFRIDLFDYCFNYAKHCLASIPLDFLLLRDMDVFFCTSSC